MDQHKRLPLIVGLAASCAALAATVIPGTNSPASTQKATPAAAPASAAKSPSATSAAAAATPRAAMAPSPSASIPEVGDPVKGNYSPVMKWPLIGIHAVLTPDGRVLSYGTDRNGIQTGKFVYDIWDPLLGTGSLSHNTLPNRTSVDVFCGAQLIVPGTGNIQLFGGDITSAAGQSTNNPNADTTLYRSLDDSLSKTGAMHRKRWYATATALANGEIYVQGGAGGKDLPEVRQRNGTYRLLTGANTSGVFEYYPRNFLAPDGQVFGFNNQVMYRIKTAGAGAFQRVGTFPGPNIGWTSSAVMIAPSKILQVGGGNLQAASSQAHVIDIATTVPNVEQVASMTYPRHWHNATVLADGRVLVSGGSQVANKAVNVAYTSEIYDPAQKRWTQAAKAQRMRLYHSTALLLPDATVLTMAGGAAGSAPVNNLDAEIYYPPYLFLPSGKRAPRPVITSAPLNVQAGATISIGTPNAGSIKRVALVKTGSVTHSFDMDQRYVELPFTVADHTLTAVLPQNKAHTPPGSYLLFVINSLGTPSQADILRISPPPV